MRLCPLQVGDQNGAEVGKQHHGTLLLYFDDGPSHARCVMIRILLITLHKSCLRCLFHLPACPRLWYVLEHCLFVQSRYTGTYGSVVNAATRIYSTMKSVPHEGLDQADIKLHEHALCLFVDAEDRYSVGREGRMLHGESIHVRCLTTINCTWNHCNAEASSGKLSRY